MMPSSPASSLARLVFKAASGSLALQLTALVLGFASNILLARLLGTSGYGEYAYLLAWVNFLFVPAMLGTNKLLVREVAILNTRAQWGPLRGIVSWCGRWVLLTALLLSMVMILAASLRTENSGDIALDVLLVASILIPLLALTGLRQAILQGLGAVVRGQLPETLIRPSLFIVAILAWAMFSGWELALFDAIVLNVGAAFVAFVVGAVILHRRFPGECRGVTREETPRVWLIWSLPLLLLGFSQAGSAQLPLLVLGYVSPDNEVGLFAAASRLATLGNFFLLALNAAFAPRIAALYAAGEIASLQSLVSRTSLWVTVLSLIPLLVFVFAGQWVLAIFGADFSQASGILIILASGVFVNATMGSVGLLLTMTRNVRAALYAAIIALAINVLVSAILIPLYGPVGAAWATAIVMVVGNLACGFFVYTKIGIIPTFAALALPRRDK